MEVKIDTILIISISHIIYQVLKLCNLVNKNVLKSYF